MQKLISRVLRPFLGQNIAQIIGSGELKAGVRAYFRFFLPPQPRTMRMPMRAGKPALGGR